MYSALECSDTCSFNESSVSNKKDAKFSVPKSLDNTTLFEQMNLLIRSVMLPQIIPSYASVICEFKWGGAVLDNGTQLILNIEAKSGRIMY